MPHIYIFAHSWNLTCIVCTKCLATLLLLLLLLFWLVLLFVVEAVTATMLWFCIFFFIYKLFDVCCILYFHTIFTKHHTYWPETCSMLCVSRISLILDNWRSHYSYSNSNSSISISNCVEFDGRSIFGYLRLDRTKQRNRKKKKHTGNKYNINICIEKNKNHFIYIKSK